MDQTGMILKTIDSWKDEQLDFLVSICEQNSYSANKQGVDLVSGTICEKLANIFPFHEVSSQEHFGDHHILRTSKSGQSLYLLGHVDTVFPQDHPFQTCRRKDGWLYGPGTADMKGGLAVIVFALKALHQTGVIPSLNLTFILGGDEEAGSASSRQIYTRECRNALACLVAECAGEQGEFVISRNGKLGGRFDCTGFDRHVGSASNKKSSAVLEIAHKIIDLESLNARLSGVRCNAGRVEGGLGPATIARSATLQFDVRWKDEDQVESIQRLLNEIAIKNYQPGCSTQMIVLNRRPAMPSGKMDERFNSVLNSIGTKLNIPIRYEHRHGSSDANFFGSAGVPTLDGFGPIGLDDHTPKERILIESLFSRTKILALLLFSLSTQNF